MKRLVITTVIGSLLLATASFAQDDKEGKIQQRKENQQQRIGNGVKNGSLTAGETSKLEHQESKVNKEVRTDRKANGGNLTNNQKAQVNQQQNKLSKEIYNDKHNAAKQSQ
ncbi:MAG: hypothetical protein ABSB35_10815 [Bryobacteraceae bacterium]|jgi:Ni/Co efflux regulator RcnB